MWSGGREAMLRFGPDNATVVIVAPALFEEANRTRTLTVGILRRLAARGIASRLPDLPGQNESLVPTEQASLADWREAFHAAAADVAQPLIFAVRGGSLIVDGMAAPYCLSPVVGGDLVRDMVRARQAAVREGGAALDTADMTPPGPPIELAGNLLSRALLAELGAAQPPVAARTVRLDSDPRPADHRIAGAPPWRRSEPGDDTVLADLLAADLAGWVAACAG